MAAAEKPGLGVQAEHGNALAALARGHHEAAPERKRRPVDVAAPVHPGLHVARECMKGLAGAPQVVDPYDGVVGR